ncbi:MAG: hypothetical protein JST54_30975 [Deltaproteobacteria bacterium]|nr:hypothetical protein [Deltaproteobacteria bacterium]
MKHALAISVAVLALAGCDGSPPPGRQVSVSATGMTYEAQPQSFDGTDKLTWDVDVESAYVRYDGTALTQGTVQVTFLDAAGAVVLHTSIAAGPAPASGPTNQGKPGPWTVRLDYSNASGTVAFSAAPAH